MREIQAGSICHDNRGVSDFTGRETLGVESEEKKSGERMRDAHGTFRVHFVHHLPVAVTFVAKQRIYHPSRDRRGREIGHLSFKRDAERHPRRDYATRSFRYAGAWYEP